MCCFLYCGIVECVFECCFYLVDYVIVLGVELCNGMFLVQLVCEILEFVKLCSIVINIEVVFKVKLIKGGKIEVV